MKIGARQTWSRFAMAIAVSGGGLLAGTTRAALPPPREATTARTAPAVATFVTTMTNLLASSAATLTNSVNEHDVLETTPARKQMYAGMLLVQDKEYAKALPKLEFAIKEDPALLGAWEALGWAYWNLGRKDESQRLWERLQRLDPREPLAYNLLAQLANSRGDIEKSGALLKTSLDLRPEQYEARYWYAQNLLWRGHSDQAAPMLRQLLVEDSERIDVRIELARALTELLEYEDALDHWAKVNDAIPDNPDYLIPEAQCLLRIGEIRQAETNAMRVLDMAPENLKALNLLVDIAEYSNDPEEAVKALGKLAERTDNKMYRCRLRLRLSNLQKTMSVKEPLKFPVSEAISNARKGLDDDPRYVSGRLYLGELYIAARRYGDAEDTFKTVLKDYNANSLRAKIGLIECYLATARFEDCERMILDTYRNFDPINPYRHMYMARLEFARGQFFEALRELDLLEAEGLRGAVFTTLYHGLSTSEWEPVISTRRFQEHILSLKQAGYKFISADRIPAYFAAHKSPELPIGKPWLYRMIRSLEYDFTGKEAPALPDMSLYSPDKVACITFDDALRASIRLGTPVAEEFQIPLSMHIPTHDIDEGQIGMASWDELRQAEQSGSWVFGSHLVDHDPIPVDKGKYVGTALVNRGWDAEHNRLETMRSWFLRVRREFAESRRTIVKKLDLDEDGCKFVAYPYGDIGQETDSNIEEIQTVHETVLDEAYVHYTHGFVQSVFGHACATDNPLLYQRYEPEHQQSGPDLLKQALENNPVMLARRMRAEMAALQGKPYLANKMLSILERDGYPDDSLRELSQYIRERLSNQLAATPEAATDKSTKDKTGLELSQPYLGAEIQQMRANDQISEWELTLRGGLNLTPHLLVDAHYGTGNIKQTFTSNVWSQVTRTKVTNERQVTTTTENGVTTSSDSTTTTFADETTTTNRKYKTSYQADTTVYGLRSDYRFQDGTLFSANLGQRTLSGADEQSTDGSELVFGIALQWKPFLAVDSMLQYQHDLAPSARKPIGYDAAGLSVAYRAEDWWDLSGSGQYSFYEDDNSVLQLNGRSMWLVSERRNLYLGVEASLITVAQASDYYWSPYWEQRYYIVARIVRTRPKFFASAEAKLGEVHDRARQADVDAYNTLKAQATPPALSQNQAWYPGPNPQQGWSPSIGLNGTLRRRWGQHWELYGNAGITFLNDYSEHNLDAGAIYYF